MIGGIIRNQWSMWPFRVSKWPKKTVWWVMASVNKPVGLSCGIWKMFETKSGAIKDV